MATRHLKVASKPVAAVVHGSPAWFYDRIQESANGVISERVKLTPTLAKALLRNNPDNRALRPIKLGQFMSDIREGRWTFNGEPILISKEGMLNDGQHRASAVVETNVAIDTMITFGVERESRITIDQGAARTAGDYLEMDGIPNAVAAASVARLILSYERMEGKALGRSCDITSAEIMDRVVSDEAIRNAAKFTTNHRRHYRHIMTPQIVGFCHVVFNQINPTDAASFLEQVCVGENIKRSDPAFAVREALARPRTTMAEKIHLLFRGWNAFRQHRKMDLAKVTGNLPALI